MSSMQANVSRRRNLPKPALDEKAAKETDAINGALTRRVGTRVDSDGSPRILATSDTTKKMINAGLSALLPWGIMMGFIFGGCCSNVSALGAFT